MHNNFIDSIFNLFLRKSGNDLNDCNLKLIQTLVLCPGQNLYVVEVYERKILLGGTIQGGIHYLTDLTPKEESKENPGNNISTMLLNSNFMPHDLLPEEELTIPEQKLDVSIPTYKQAIKRKVTAQHVN